MFQLIGEAEVIDDESAGLVPENTVHAGDGLHEAVALHRFVGIHRVEAGRVEAGQPHVAHDHDAEGVFAILESLRQSAALGLVADVRLPIGAVVGTARHHDLHHALLFLLGFAVVVRGTGPLGTEADQLIVEIDADAAAHAHDHGLAVHRLPAALKVLHEVRRDEFDALRIADEGLQSGPFRFQFLPAILLLGLGDFGKFGVELREGGRVEAQLGDAALVVDRDRGFVGDGALDVVDGNIVAEHGPGIGIRLLDGRAGKPNE